MSIKLIESQVFQMTKQYPSLQLTQLLSIIQYAFEGQYFYIKDLRTSRSTYSLDCAADTQMTLVRPLITWNSSGFVSLRKNLHCTIYDPTVQHKYVNRSWSDKYAKPGQNMSSRSELNSSLTLDCRD